MLVRPENTSPHIHQYTGTIFKPYNSYLDGVLAAEHEHLAVGRQCHRAQLQDVVLRPIQHDGVHGALPLRVPHSAREAVVLVRPRVRAAGRVRSGQRD